MWLSAVGKVRLVTTRDYFTVLEIFTLSIDRTACWLTFANCNEEKKLRTRMYP